jgi:GAF domain-containing protein
MKQLEQMRAAAAALAHITTLPIVVHEAVRQARKVLGADSAVLWVYDEQRRKFMPSLSSADGVPLEWWQAARQAEPHSGGLVLDVMEKGWFGVSNLQDEEAGTKIGLATRQRLAQIGVQSFQAIALTGGDDKLGVLFLYYKRRRRFSGQEQAATRTFAHHVALALNNTRLVEQLGKIGEMV